MGTAEVLAMIVERACLYVPETPVDVKNVNKPNRLTKEFYPKEAFSEVDKVPKEALTSVESKVFAASSDLVNLNEIVLN